MTKTFEVTYFDGQSTQSHAARLWLRMDAWEIHVQGDETHPTRVIRWPITDIHRNAAASQNNTFLFGEFPHQAVYCRDADLPRTLQTFYPEMNFIDRQQSWFGSNIWAKIGLLTLVLLGLAGLLYFWALPKMAEALADRIPREYEIQLGDRLAEGMLQSMDIDSSKTAALQAFADLADFKTDYALHFTVVHSEDINAFALPGGRIVVYDALLNRIENPAALLGLLAHEATHVSKRHTLKALASSLATYMFVALMFGDVSGLTAVLLENANKIQGLQFSRGLEQEADQEALKILSANQMDQHGMVALLKTLQSSSGGAESKAMQFLSTHPLTEDRLRMAKESADAQVAVEGNAGLEAAFGEVIKAAEEAH